MLNSEDNVSPADKVTGPPGSQGEASRRTTDVSDASRVLSVTEYIQEVAGKDTKLIAEWNEEELKKFIDTFAPQRRNRILRFFDEKTGGLSRSIKAFGYETAGKTYAALARGESRASSLFNSDNLRTRALVHVNKSSQLMERVQHIRRPPIRPAK